MTQETKQIREERIAMGCLGCYNDGRLTFKWMNADELREAIEVGVVKSVCSRPHCGDEWHIQDYDGKIGRFSSDFGEWPDLERLADLMDLLDETPDTRYVAGIEAAMEYHGRSIPTAEQVEDAVDELQYVGEYESDIKDFFMEYAYSTGAMKEGHPMESYIDWEHYAQDMMHYYSKIVIQHGTHEKSIYINAYR
jgi:antirestriction protein